MEESKIKQFAQLYQNFLKSGRMESRNKQIQLVPTFREIIEETLKNDPLENKHLTGLIQMLGAGSKTDTFQRYLTVNIKNSEKRDKILAKFKSIGETGFTGRGLQAIASTKQEELKKIKLFLKEVFSVKTVEHGMKLTKEFNDLKIPQITPGIYSPWLYYINPGIFPIINNSTIRFRKWLGMPSDYPSFIESANQLMSKVNETDHGRLDWFAHLYGINAPEMEQLDIGDRKLFKVSHGSFINYGPFKKAGILKILEEKNWIAMGNETGLNQFDIFSKEARIGDYVYVCYGGKNVYAIGQISSEVKSLNKALNNFPSKEEWSYREINLLFKAQNSNVAELTGEKKNFMPGGNSTFWEVPQESITDLNEKIFMPKFGVEILTTKISGNGPGNTESRNTILYGPPGTGKTYNALPMALNIINGFELKDSYSKEEWIVLKKQFDDLREEGRIEFVTFHQSMSYEDFVEGIKPKMDETSTEKGEIPEQLHYEISDGVFKRIADRAAATEKISQHSENYKMPDDILSEIDNVGFGKIRFENWVPGNEVYEYCMENNVICVPYEVDLDFSDSNNESQTEQILTDNKYGWHEKVGIKTIKHWLKKEDIVFITSVGKNSVKAVAQITSDYYYNPDSSISFSHFRKVKWLMKDVNIPVDSVYSTQFSSYAASLLYRARVRKDFFKKQDKRENLKYVLIIDEINRGNIANIFGELITLLEPSKRVGESEHLKIKLPYSKNDFEVSSNLYLIGTMNTADRSVEALDTALRRRFSFREMVPNPELIKTAGALRETDGKIGDIDVVKLLETINKRLEKLIDKDHRIGHSYFMHIKTEAELQLAFKDKVIPLLEEYFFGDFGKIGLVLGSSFVEKLKDNAVFASFDDYGDAKQDLAERPVYKIKDPIEWDFISIYQ